MIAFVLTSLVATTLGFSEFPPLNNLCNDTDGICAFLNSTSCSVPSVAAKCAKSCGCCDAKTCNTATCNGGTQDSCCFDSEPSLCPFINTTTACSNETIRMKCERTCSEPLGCCASNQCPSYYNQKLICCKADEVCQPSGSDSGGVPYDGGCCSTSNWCDFGGCCDADVDCCNPSGGGGGGGGGGMTCCNKDTPRCAYPGTSEEECVECVCDADCTDPNKGVCVFDSYDSQNFCAECYKGDGCNPSTEKCSEQYRCEPQ